MRVDEPATKVARAKQRFGIAVLNLLFGFTPMHAPLNAQTGRSIAEKSARRIWREWRDETFPPRVKRRRRRKLANESRRRNRTR